MNLRRKRQLLAPQPDKTLYGNPQSMVKAVGAANPMSKVKPLLRTPGTVSGLGGRPTLQAILKNPGSNAFNPAPVLTGPQPLALPKPAVISQASGPQAVTQALAQSQPAVTGPQTPPSVQAPVVAQAPVATGPAVPMPAVPSPAPTGPPIQMPVLPPSTPPAVVAQVAQAVAQAQAAPAPVQQSGPAPQAPAPQQPATGSGPAAKPPVTSKYQGLPVDPVFEAYRRQLDDELAATLRDIGYQEEQIPAALELAKLRLANDQDFQEDRFDEDTAARGIYRSGLRGQGRGDIGQTFDRQRQNMATDTASQLNSLASARSGANLTYSRGLQDAFAELAERLREAGYDPGGDKPKPKPKPKPGDKDKPGKGSGKGKPKPGQDRGGIKSGPVKYQPKRKQPNPKRRDVRKNGERANDKPKGGPAKPRIKPNPPKKGKR